MAARAGGSVHTAARSQMVLSSMKVDRADMELLAQEAEFRNIPRSELIRLAIKAAAADWRSSPDRPRPCRARGCGRRAAFKNDRCVTCAAAEGMTDDQMVTGALAGMMGMGNA